MSFGINRIVELVELIMTGISSVIIAIFTQTCFYRIFWFTIIFAFVANLTLLTINVYGSMIEGFNPGFGNQVLDWKNVTDNVTRAASHGFTTQVYKNNLDFIAIAQFFNQCSQIPNTSFNTLSQCVKQENGTFSCYLLVDVFDR